MEYLFLLIMSAYRLYFKEKKVWLIRKSRLFVANLITLLEQYYSTNFSWALEVLFALILSISFQFNYLQTENEAIMAYQLVLNTGFWFVFLRMISRYLRGKRLHYENFNILLSLGLYVLLWLPFGLDLTDEGWRLESAVKLWEFPEHYLNKTSVIGSDILLGLWLKIGPDHLIWSRLGFLLVVLFIATYCFKLLRIFYTTNALSILVVISMIYFLSNVRMVPDYNNLGIMFLLGAAYHLTKSERSDKLWLHAGLSGLFLASAILCNFSLVVFALVFPFYNLFFRKKYSIGYFGISLAASFALLIGFIYILGLSDAYFSEIGALISQIFGTTSNSSIELSYHSPSCLLERYLKDFKQLGVLTLIDMGVLFAGTLLLPKIHRAARIFVFLVCYLLIWFISSSYSFEFVVSSLILSLLMLSTFIQTVNQKNFRAWFWGISIFFLSFLGSNNGVYAITFTGGTILLCPIILVTLKSRLLRWNSGTFSLRFHTIGAFFFILIFSYWAKPDFIYRDANATELNTSFNLEGFGGIISTPERVNVCTEIIKSVEGLGGLERNVLFVNHLATLNAMSQVAHPLSWQLFGSSIEAKSEEIFAQNELAYVLINKMDPRDRNWPNSKMSFHKMDAQSIEVYSNMISNGKLEAIKESEYYALYKFRRN